MCMRLHAAGLVGLHVPQLPNIELTRPMQQQLADGIDWAVAMQFAQRVAAIFAGMHQCVI